MICIHTSKSEGSIYVVSGAALEGLALFNLSNLVPV